jgi:hypothetical protein
MAYISKSIEVMIASPSDVADERKVVRDVIAEWNAIYSRSRGISLMPVGWETHYSPELSGRPQQMINDRLLAYADILVGIFWTRVGSPTGKAISGSVEEIEEHLKQNKPVMLYFSEKPVALDSVDPAQYESLKAFKAWAKDRGLFEVFSDRDDFRDKFRMHLPLALENNSYLRDVLSNEPSDSQNIGTFSDFVAAFEAAQSPLGKDAISEDARDLLSAAAADSHGIIMVSHYIGGTAIQANNNTFGEPDNRRSVARWEAAVHELEEKKYIKDVSGKGEMFEITNVGYRLVDGMS